MKSAFELYTVANLRDRLSQTTLLYSSTMQRHNSVETYPFYSVIL